MTCGSLSLRDWPVLFKLLVWFPSYPFDVCGVCAAAAKSLQSCPTLCDPIDSSPPGSPVPGILQARTLEWVAISFSNAGKWKVKVKSLSRVRLLATPQTTAYQAPPSMGFSRQEHWSGVPLPSPAWSVVITHFIPVLVICIFSLFSLCLASVCQFYWLHPLFSWFPQRISFSVDLKFFLFFILNFIYFCF